METVCLNSEVLVHKDSDIDQENSVKFETLEGSTESDVKNLSESDIDLDIADKTEKLERSEESAVNTDSFIEFEFIAGEDNGIDESATDNDSSVHWENSPTPDPEAVLDELYAAASRGDPSSLADLIFIDKQNTFSGNKKRKSSFINLNNKNQSLKKVAKKDNSIKNALGDVEKDHFSIRSGQIVKLPKRGRENDIVAEVVTDKRQRTDDGNFTAFKSKKNSLNQIEALPQKKLFPNKELIDYSVLTRALTRTLESKLENGEENDVKIVIFCNNKPVQSFSLRNNAKTESATSLNSVVSASPEVFATKVDTIEKIDEHLGVSLNGVAAAVEIVRVPKVNIPSDHEDNNEDDEKLIVDDDANCTDIEKSLETTDENCNNTSDEISCDACGKTFRLRRYLNRHKIRVHGVGCNFSVPAESQYVICDAAIANGNGPKNRDVVSTGQNIGENSLSEFDLCKVKAEALDEEIGYQYIKSLFEQETTPDSNSSPDKNTLKSQAILPKPHKQVQTRRQQLQISKTGVIEPVFVCEQCGKFYRARKTLRDHFWREHANSKDDEPLYLYISGNKYHCPICFINFHTGMELVAHCKRHTDESRSECKICGKVYSSVHVLRRHIDSIHEEVKPRPFECELCDYKASNKWHLKEHYRRHTGEQPYKCPICEKAFSHQGTMNRHCKTLHKIELASQRPYARTTINDLPTLIPPDGDLSSTSDLPQALLQSALPLARTVFAEALKKAQVSSKAILTDPLHANAPSMRKSPKDAQYVDVNMSSGSAEGSNFKVNLDLTQVKTEPDEIEVDKHLLTRF